VDMSPDAVSTLPDSRFATRRGSTNTIVSDSLSQSDISDDGDLSHDADAWGTQGGRDTGIGRGRFHIKVVLVKWHPLDQVTLRFRFKSGQVFGTESRVGLPITVDDGFDQLASQFNDFLIIHVFWSVWFEGFLESGDSEVEVCM